MKKFSDRKDDSIFSLTVIASALGYFVDIYDLLLFSIVRTQSLKDIGLSGEELLSSGVSLLNYQMSGLLIGGIFWGILGDKKGRVSVLFGSILIYSLANLLNGFVSSIESYRLLRLIAGFGLAGELGAAITLVSETLPQRSRGYGTSIVAAIGILGAVVAALIGDYFSWRVSYIIGGLLGLSLLLLRLSVFESSLFEHVKNKGAMRGNLKLLLLTKERAWRYIACILVGVPIWFVVGILITFSPELAQALSIDGIVSSGKAVLFCYGGLSIGDLVSGFLSQYLRSRKKVLLFFQSMTLIITIVYLFSKNLNLNQFYLICGILGFFVGYWAVFMTVSAEQFGTNLRATVTTTSPNFVRGTVVPMSMAFQMLSTHLGLIHSALIVGIVVIVTSIFATMALPESHHKDLDFVDL